MSRRGRRARWLARAAFAITAAACPDGLPAQAAPIASEIRIDGLMADHAAIELGASLIVPAGLYSRTAFTAATGVVRRDGTMSATRVEVVSRFLLDPLRESPYGLSVGGGLGVTNSAGGPHWRPYLALVFDLEVGDEGGWTPAFQIGLGAGARVGIAVRSGSPSRR